MFSVRAPAQLLQKLQQPRPAPQGISSGIDALDDVLPHRGFPAGHLTEISGSRSCGKRTIVLEACRQRLAQNQIVIWIDGTGNFYPLALLEQGYDLSKLVVVRPTSDPTTDRRCAVLTAADILMRVGHVAPLIVLDFGASPTSKEQKKLCRIRLHAETTGSAAILIVDQPDKRHSLGPFISLHLSVTRNGDQQTEVLINKSKLGNISKRARIDLNAPHQLHLDTTL